MFSPGEISQDQVRVFCQQVARVKKRFALTQGFLSTRFCSSKKKKELHFHWKVQQELYETGGGLLLECANDKEINVLTIFYQILVFHVIRCSFFDQTKLCEK